MPAPTTAPDLEHNPLRNGSPLQNRFLELGAPFRWAGPEGAAIEAAIGDLRRLFCETLDRQARPLRLFGSHERGTMLPPWQDPEACIDALIPFHDLGLPAWEYLNMTRSILETRIGADLVACERVDMRLSLGHTRIRLLPAVQSPGGPMRIIRGDRGPLTWLKIDPDGAKERLNQADNAHQGCIKPLVRIIKAWNAHSSHPMGGYAVENAILNHEFRQGRHLAFMVFDAIDGLPLDDSLDHEGRNALLALKDAAAETGLLEAQGCFKEALATFEPLMPFRHTERLAA